MMMKIILIAAHFVLYERGVENVLYIPSSTKNGREPYDSQKEEKKKMEETCQVGDRSEFYDKKYYKNKHLLFINHSINRLH